MSISYNAQDVLCPFYVKDEKCVLTCEGFPGSCTHKHVYQNRADLLKQMEVFCSTWHFKNCETYRLIMESKYNDERE